MGSDRTNAVLGLMDDLSDPALAPGPSAQDQSSVDHFEDARRIVASWSQWKREVFSKVLTDQPPVEAKPDPIRAVYGRFKHLDGLLCEINDEDEDFRKTAAALWLAVKAKVEGQPAGQTEQAKE